MQVSTGKITIGNIDPEKTYLPGEVARMFRVDPKTVTRWAKTGRLEYFRTLGGHRRFMGQSILNYLRSQE